MSKRLLLAISALLTGFLGPLAVQAHHSIAAEYGDAQRVYLEGVVSELYWTNPHVRIRVVTTQGGDVPANETWDVTTHPPGNLARNFDFPPEKLKVGDHVRIYGRRSQFGIPRFLLAGISVNGGEEEWLLPATQADDRVEQE